VKSTLMIKNHFLPKKYASTLQEEITQHTRMGDRSKIIQAIRQHKELQSILFNPTISPKYSKIARKDALNDTIIINNMPQSKMVYFTSLKLLSDLCHQTCINDNIDIDPKQAYDTLVLRLSRRCLTEDVFMNVENVLGTWNLLVWNYFDYMNMKKNELDPIEVNVFSENHQLHASIYVEIRYGLIEKSTINGKGEIDNHGYLTMNSGRKQQKQKTKNDIKPWIKFNVVICERINLSTGNNVRYGKIIFFD